MIVNYWLLSIALVLLWLPRQWLRVGGKVITGSKARKRNRENKNPRNPGDLSLRFKEEALKVRNWMDLVRAAVGAAVVEGVCFEQVPDAGREIALQIFALRVLIYVVAVLIQTIRLESRLTLSPPVFFALGLSFGLLGWMGALFACVAIWVINLVLPGAATFLFVFSGLQVCFGVLLARLPVREAALAGGLSMIPVLLSLMTKRRLMQLSRRSKPIRLDRVSS